MFYLLGMFAVVLIVGTLLIRLTVIVMGERAGKFLAETHGAIEYIHATGAVPPQWLAPFQHKLQQLEQNDPENQTATDRIVRAARKTCLKNLAKLRKYIYNSSLVEDEETRQILLKKLANVHEKWTEQDWQEIVRS